MRNIQSPGSAVDIIVIMLLLSSQDNILVILIIKQDQACAEQDQMCVCLCNTEYPMQTHELEPFLGKLSVEKLRCCFIATCLNMIFTVLWNHQMLH